jgi:hypothetical protein
VNGEPVVLALASAAADAGVRAVELDGAMAVLLVRDPRSLASETARERVLAVAKAAGIRSVAVELVDDDGAAPRLPRD